MFGIGPIELMVIGVLALMLFSPRELPKVIRSVTRFWAQIRQTADDFRDAIMDEDALGEPVRQIKGAYQQTQAELRRAEAQARQEVMKARIQMRKAEQKLMTATRKNDELTRTEHAEKLEARDDARPVASSSPTAAAGSPAPAADPTAGPTVAGSESPSSGDKPANAGAA